MTTTTLVRRSLLAVSVTAALSAGSAFATNGLAPTGLGMEHRAMGGAAAANPVNTMSMATNPASAAYIEDGYDAGLELFMPDRVGKYNAPGDPRSGTVYDGNGKDMFLVPEGGYKRSVNDKVAVGVVAYGNGGMNTSYKTSPAFGAAPDFSAGTGKESGVDMAQLFISPTVSYKINDSHAVGLSANLVYQRFEAKGIDAFAGLSADPANLTDRGYDSSTGIGATIGWQAKLNDDVTLGASYRTKTSMSKMDKYAGLFPNGGEFDVPAATTLGLAIQATPKTKIAVDAQHIKYAGVAATGNAPVLAPGSIGTTAGFGWDDQTVIKIGVKHQLNPTLALMAGYNHGASPVGSEETNINVLAPAVVEDHISLGFEKKLSPKSSLIGAYVHAFDKEIKGDLTQGQIYDIKMNQNAVGLAYSRKF